MSDLKMRDFSKKVKECASCSESSRWLRKDLKTNKKAAAGLPHPIRLPSQYHTKGYRGLSRKIGAFPDKPLLRVAMWRAPYFVLSADQ